MFAVWQLIIVTVHVIQVVVKTEVNKTICNADIRAIYFKLQRYGRSELPYIQLVRHKGHASRCKTEKNAITPVARFHYMHQLCLFLWTLSVVACVLLSVNLHLLNQCRPHNLNIQSKKLTRHQTLKRLCWDRMGGTRQINEIEHRPKIIPDYGLLQRKQQHTCI